MWPFACAKTRDNYASTAGDEELTHCRTRVPATMAAAQDQGKHVVCVLWR